VAPNKVKLSVAQRERAILRHLLEAETGEGASVPQIYRSLTTEGATLSPGEPRVADDVSLPVYYKLVRRMVASGLLVPLGDGDPEDGQRYELAPHLHADTALTLDDIRELVQTMAPTESIAALMDAREYVKERRDTVLRSAARALQRVPPRVLVEELVVGKVEEFNADVRLWREHGGDDDAHLARIRTQRRDLDQLCYRWLGLSHEAVVVPPASDEPAVAEVDLAVLRRQIARRVYGPAVIHTVAPDGPHAPADWSNVVTAGSDGSTYSSVMQVDSAASFTDDSGSEVVTFNNSVVHLHLEGDNARRHPSPWHSVPLTRSAIDSPRNTGMVMAPFMFRSHGLSGSDYEHMAKCATDVVQWRADERVFRGHGRSLGDGSALPPPTVHFRDGTVTLQERESHHYQRVDPYGDMVREGVRLSHDILAHIRDRRVPPVFAGAVKGSQIRLFATVVNWFIARGCRGAGVAPVDPGWDVARGAYLADNEAMTMLLASIAAERGDAYHVTFAVVRPFHALTDLYRGYRSEAPGAWEHVFASRRANQLADSMSDTYWRTVPEVADDPYVRMFEYADYALFYIGHTEGDPAPLLPRYEFLESLRAMSADDAEARVARNVALTVAALHRTAFCLDTDHNFLSRKRLVKIVPRVLYDAHEKCKALGRQLESELRSMVIANLARLRSSHPGVAPDVRFRPLAIRAYIERYARALRHDDALGPGDGDGT